MIIVTGTVKFESLDEVEQITKILIGRAQRSREDFNTLLATATITRAIVFSNEANEDRVLLEP